MSLRGRYSPRITNRDFKLPSTIRRNVMLGYKEKTNKQTKNNSYFISMYPQLRKVRTRKGTTNIRKKLKTETQEQVKKYLS